MEITIGIHSGFCIGVKKAVELAMNININENENVYVLGDLIHNPTVNKKLADKGIKKIDDISEVESGTVIIRSHGVSSDIYQSLEDKNINIIDATCVFVKNIHKKVEKYFRDGYQIVIIGDKNHPEVQGINGWCGNSAIIVDDEDSNIDLTSYDKSCIVVQTTYSKQKYAKIIKNLITDDSKIVEVFDTICYTTIERQAEAQKLAGTHDCVVVIGGKTSSNTKKLFDLCSINCENVFLIEYPSELELNTIKHFNKVAIVAGASTPNELIKEVYLRMEQLNNAAEINDEAVETEQVKTEVIETEAEVSANSAETEQNVADSVVAAGNVDSESKADEAETVKVEEKLSPMDQALKDMDAKENKFRRGHAVKATIALVSDDMLVLAIGARKSDVQLDKNDIEIDGSYDKTKFEVGDVIDVVVTEERPLKVSRRQYLLNLQDDALVEEIKNGKEFSVSINGNNKGGLTGKFGSFTVFIPASHIRMGFVKPEEFDKYTGKELRLKLVEIKGKTLIASAKKVIEEERQRREEARSEAIKAFFASIEVGQIVEGKVVRFTDFGAFVNVNGFDCLAHISDLAWTNVKKAEDIITKDTVYEFVILKIDHEKEHVSIGYKQLQPKPWDIVADKYPAESIIKGKVVRIAPFGAFVEVEPGVDGLVHVSQITHEWIENPASALKVGDEIEAKVIEVKPEVQKLTLSIKALMPEPEGFQQQRPRRDSYDESKFAIDKKPRGERRSKTKREDYAPREWSSSDNSGASIGDLLKDLNIDIKE